MSVSLLRTGANLMVKVAYDSGPSEKLIGYCTALTYNVNHGVKVIHTVDSPFPSEIANSAVPMQVSGTMSLIMPKGMTLESAGLVPYRTAGAASPADIPIGGNTAVNSADSVYIAGGKYMFIRVYDRESNQLVFGCEYCKILNYQVNISAKAVVRADINFVGRFMVPGAG